MSEQLIRLILIHVGNAKVMEAAVEMEVSHFRGLENVMKNLHGLREQLEKINYILLNNKSEGPE